MQLQFLKSRKFWTLLIDAIGIIGGFIVAKYFPQSQDAIIVVVGAIQPLVFYLITQFTVDDAVASVMRVMGKTLMVLVMLGIVASVFVFVAPAPAYAAGPSDADAVDALTKAPELYAIAGQLGVDPIRVAKLWIDFNNTWFATHPNKWTPELMGLTQNIRIGEFAHRVYADVVFRCDEIGCPRMPIYRDLVPVYQQLFAY